MNTSKSRNSEKGEFYENLAADYLRSLGFVIVERHYRYHRNEIDIIALGEGCYIFAEVKARSRKDWGYGYQAVDKRKQASIRRVAEAYLVEKRLPLYDTTCRFDVISFDNGELRHFRNAF